MLTLSLTEIRDRAQAFATSWAGETREHAEAKSFWDGFCNVLNRAWDWNDRLPLSNRNS